MKMAAGMPMRGALVTFVILMLAIGTGTAGAQPGATAPAPSADYMIGPEDVLQVSVWMHPELERSVTVDTKGNITFAPIGEIKAAGYSAKALSDRVSDRLSTYLRQT